jgi:hypothetical protein
MGSQAGPLPSPLSDAVVRRFIFRHAPHRTTVANTPSADRVYDGLSERFRIVERL